METHKRIAELLADKQKEKYTDVINQIKTCLRFAMLKSILVALRGGKGKDLCIQMKTASSNISFSLIPFVPTYEGC